MKPMKMLLAAALVLLAGLANAAEGVMGWNTTNKDWVKIRASASGFMFSGQDANDYITLYSATTATTGAKPVQALPVGAYRVRATVTGSGAVSSTIEVYCNNTEANTGGTQQSTDIVLSDTDADTDVLAADITTACPYIYVEVDAVSASSALNIVAIPIYSAATAAGSSSTSPAYVVGGYTSGACTDDGDVDTLETICEVTVSGYNAITFQGTVATAAFSDFNIDFSNDGTNYVNYYTATADYTPVCSADPTTWSSTHILCRLSGLAGIQKVRLQAAGTNSDPTITYQVQ